MIKTRGNLLDKTWVAVVLITALNIGSIALNTPACKRSQPPATPVQTAAAMEMSVEMLGEVLKLIQQAERDRPGAVVDEVNRAWEPIWGAYLVAENLEKAAVIVMVDAGNGGTVEALRDIRAATCGVGRLLVQHDSRLAPMAALLCF